MPGVDSSGITLVASQATTSGTAWDFTGIPSWVKRIIIMLNGFSTNGISPPQVQIGSGSISNTGYSNSNSVVSSAAATANFTTGFGIGVVATSGWSAAMTISGSLTLTLQDTGVWTCVGMFGASNIAAIYLTSGSKTLGGNLDRVRLTTVNGTDAGDSGSVSISYE